MKGTENLWWIHPLMCAKLKGSISCSEPCSSRSEQLMPPQKNDYGKRMQKTLISLGLWRSDVFSDIFLEAKILLVCAGYLRQLISLFHLRSPLWPYGSCFMSAVGNWDS
uniref:Uncharacterized protein n=1 Tax=Trypanosoma congolense (strain IL3000) TaxID=1068625 RepID=G0UKM8_TRYCI|nr:hypothetical protein, unlikely [Trypanosoma congolense IL3000]